MMNQTYAAELSVWALLAKSTFYKILAVLLMMIATERLLFWKLLDKYRSTDNLEDIISRFSPVVFWAAFGLVFFILARTEGLWNSHSQYTLMRLRITQMQLFVCKSIYNLLCLAMLFAVQAGLVFWMAGLYADGQEIPQILFLAFYRSEFLHGLLPMAETGKWIRNLLLLLTFAVEAAGAIGQKKQIAQIGLFIMTISWFITPIGIGFKDVMSSIVYAGSIVRGIYDTR